MAKKIGFVDYYLSEWHADNYPVWIKEASTEYEVAYGWAERDISPVSGKSTDEWCAQFGVEKCERIEELCEKSDVIVILAPSNPEKHLLYAERVLPFGKPTYIDKTFAPDLDTAKKIFALAEKHNTPFFSTSALRYASELDLIGDCRQVMTTGGGSNAPEYIVHQAEMVVKKLGVGAASVKAETVGDQTVFFIGYPDGRSASMTYGKAFPFTVYMVNSEKSVFKTAASEFFKSLIADMVRFFDERTVSFDTAETLEVMAIRETALAAMSEPGTTFKIAEE